MRQWMISLMITGCLPLLFGHFSETDPEECDKIYLELKEYYDCVYSKCVSGEITEDEARKLAELSRIILSHITADLDKDERERMVNAVGGQVLELQEDRWIKQGIEQGIDIIAVNMIKEGFSLEDTSRATGLPKAKIAQLCKSK